MQAIRFIITMLDTGAKQIVDINGNTATCDGLIININPTGELGVYDIKIGDQIIPVFIKSDGISTIRFSIRGYQYEAQVLSEDHQRYLDMISTAPAAMRRVVKISTPMPGLLKNVLVSNGEAVRKGDILFTLEAMKMENAIISPISGIVKDLSASAGQAFEKGTQLCVIANSE